MTRLLAGVGVMAVALVAASALASKPAADCGCGAREGVAVDDVDMRFQPWPA